MRTPEEVTKEIAALETSPLSIPIQLAFDEFGRCNRGFMYCRVHDNPREAAFAQVWEDECKERKWINYGYGLIQDLFFTGNRNFIFPQVICHHEVTDSERFVAATVVQWLGTNCGMSFLEEALSKCGYKIVKK